MRLGHPRSGRESRSFPVRARRAIPVRSEPAIHSLFRDRVRLGKQSCSARLGRAISYVRGRRATPPRPEHNVHSPRPVQGWAFLALFRVSISHRGGATAQAGRESVHIGSGVLAPKEWRESEADLLRLADRQTRCVAPSPVHSSVPMPRSPASPPADRPLPGIGSHTFQQWNIACLPCLNWRRGRLARILQSCSRPVEADPGLE